MRSFMRSNTFHLILSVVIAILLWMYVTYEVNPIYETVVKGVQVTCANKSDLFSDGSLEIVGENKKLLNGGVTVDIRIRGKRNAVSSTGAEDITCTLDMITVNKAGSYNIKPNVEIDKNGIEIVSITPKNIKFNVESIGQKNVDVVLKTNGNLEHGYVMEKLKPAITSVKVTGPDSVINRIDHAEIILDYSTLEMTDSEKSLELIFKNEYDEVVDSSSFSKSFEYAKVSFEIYTTRDVVLILMPKYKDEKKENASGTTVLMSAMGDVAKLTDDGGIRINANLKGTAKALESYVNSPRTVYTEPIDVTNIYSETILEDIAAASLPNNVEYVEAPKIDVKLTIKEQ